MAEPRTWIVLYLTRRMVKLAFQRQIRSVSDHDAARLVERMGAAARAAA